MRHLKYHEPKHGMKAFNCPHCGAYAEQRFYELKAEEKSPNESTPFSTSYCKVCEKPAVWIGETITAYVVRNELIFPAILGGEFPNPDMPEDCEKDYNEARAIAQASPRGAAALLRLCVQKLMRHLGQKGKDLDADIGALVEQGLPITIQQALDSCRVIGNHAVHPGEIDFDDRPETAHALFGLVNMIVDNRITQPKEIKKIFGSLPNGARKHIEKRDGRTDPE